jgi:predicted ferric reductase
MRTLPPGSVGVAHTSARVTRGWVVGFAVVLAGPAGLRLLVADTPSVWALLVDLTGLLAVSTMVCALVLSSRLRGLSRAAGVTAVMSSHRFLGMLTVALVLAHVAFVVAEQPDNVVLLGWVDAPARARAGTGAALALAGVVALGVLRRSVRHRYENWRVAHLALAVAALGLTALHVWLIGKLVHDALLGWALAGLAGLALGALAYRFPGAALRTSEYVVRAVRPESATVCTVVLDPRGRPLQFAPGQFAWFRLENRLGAEEHPFTIASAAVAGRSTEITLRSTGDFGALLRGLRPGTSVWVDGPYGDFTVDQRPAAGAAMIAAGVGITPMMSMLRTLAHRHDRRPFVLVRGVREVEELIFADELADLAGRLDLAVVHVVRRAPPGWPGVTGEVDRALLRAVLPGPQQLHQLDYYVCGPPGFVDGVVHDLAALGVPDRCLRVEQFDPK